MSTYKEIVYMCLDELQLSSDDATFNEEHIIFLANKYRAFLLKKNYTDLKKEIPECIYSGPAYRGIILSIKDFSVKVRN